MASDAWESDRLGWPGNSFGKFSVGSAYSIIAGNKSGVVDFHWVWRLKCVERVKVFLWLLLKGKLLTNEERKRRKMTDNAICPVCNEEEETISHIIRGCPQAVETWKWTLGAVSFNSRSVGAVNDWVKENSLNDTKLWDGLTWSTKIVYTLWGLWKARNKFVFNHMTKTRREVAEMSKRLAMEADSSLYKQAVFK